jgi:creatinine amidohydrolase
MRDRSADGGAEPGALSALTSSEAARRANERKTVALVPTGAVEQHGPHLPLNTDLLIAAAVAEEVARRTEGVTAEPLAYGCSWHHTAFGGTVSVRTGTFIALVFDVCRSLFDSGFVPVVLNAHHGNKAPLQVALTDLAETGVRAYAFSYFDLLAGVLAEVFPDPSSSVGHACAMETSIVMYLRPELVEREAVPPGGTPPTWPDPHMFGGDDVSVVRPFEEINATGVIGRPEEASAEKGERLFQAAVATSSEAVSRILMETR